MSGIIPPHTCAHQLNLFCYHEALGNPWNLQIRCSTIDISMLIMFVPPPPTQSPLFSHFLIICSFKQDIFWWGMLRTAQQLALFLVPVLYWVSFSWQFAHNSKQTSFWIVLHQHSGDSQYGSLPGCHCLCMILACWLSWITCALGWS